MYVVQFDQGMREYMEDTFVTEENILPGINLYAVFDGHGGDYVSEYLKDNFMATFKRNLETEKESIENLMINTLKSLVVNMDQLQAKTCGSTCLIALVYNKILYIFNIGDCRAIINDGFETTHQISFDHKPNKESEKKRIEELGGFITYNDVPRVNGNLAVSRSIGDFYLHPLVTWSPELTIMNLTPANNILVLASDGVWDVLTNNYVMQIILETMKTSPYITQYVLNEAAQKIIRFARYNGSGDNITVIIVLI